MLDNNPSNVAEGLRLGEFAYLTCLKKQIVYLGEYVSKNIRQFPRYPLGCNAWHAINAQEYTKFMIILYEYYFNLKRTIHLFI